MGNQTSPRAEPPSQRIYIFSIGFTNKCVAQIFGLCFQEKYLVVLQEFLSPQPQARMPHWWLSLWKQPRCVCFPQQFTDLSSQAEVSKWDISGKKGMHSFPILECHSCWTAYYRPSNRTEQQPSCKKQRNKILQHFGSCKMHPFHHSSFYWRKQLLS